jgi:hypothetical protein
VWFHRVVKPRCQGEVCLIRYADDFVCAFQYQEDAERFYWELGERLGKFGLELSVEKTRVIPFGRDHDLGQGRIAEASISEEPGAGKPHAGICAGAVG